jgi:hypothetical protein
MIHVEERMLNTSGDPTSTLIVFFIVFSVVLYGEHFYRTIESGLTGAN